MVETASEALALIRQTKPKTAADALKQLRQQPDVMSMISQQRLKAQHGKPSIVGRHLGGPSPELMERNILDRATLESQLPEGSRLMPGQEAPFNIQRKMAGFEDAGTMERFLKSEFPENETKVFKLESGELFPAMRRPGQANFEIINQPGLSKGDIGAAVEPFTSVEGLAGIGASMFPQGRLGKAGKVILEGVASALGRGADELIDNEFYGQQDEWDEILQEATESGAFGAVSAKVGQFIEKLKQVAPEVDTPERGFVEASKRLDAPSPSLGEVADSPFFERILNVWSSASKKGRERTEAQQAAPVRAVTEEIERGVDSGALKLDDQGYVDYQALGQNLDDKTLTDIADTYERRAMSDLRKAIRSDDFTLEEGGTLTLKGIYGKGGYNDIASASIDKAYENARKLADEGNARPNLRKLKAHLEEVQKKAILVGDDGAPVTFDKITSPELKKVISQLSGVAEDQGKPFTMDVGGRQVTIDKKQRPSEVVDSLIAVRSRLYDLSRPDPNTGLHDVNTRAAQKIHDAFTDSLSNMPGNESFTSAWKAANLQYKKRLKTLEAFDVAQYKDELTVGRGEQAFEKIKSNLTGAHVGRLKKILKPEEYKGFKDTYFSDMVRNPQSLKARLDNLSDAEKRIFNPAELNTMSVYATKLNRLNKNMVSEALNTFENKVDRARFFIEKTPASEVRKTLGDVGIGLDSYRTALFSDLLQTTTSSRRGRLTINKSGFESSVKALKKNGKFNLLTKGQQRIIKDIDTYNSFLRSANDVGASLEGISILAKKSDVTRPVRALGAQIDIQRFDMMGWLSTRPLLVRAATSDKGSSAKVRATVSAALDGIQGIIEAQ